MTDDKKNIGEKAGEEIADSDFEHWEDTFAKMQTSSRTTNESDEIEFEGTPTALGPLLGQQAPSAEREPSDHGQEGQEQTRVLAPESSLLAGLAGHPEETVVRSPAIVRREQPPPAPSPPRRSVVKTRGGGEGSVENIVELSAERSEETDSRGDDSLPVGEVLRAATSDLQPQEPPPLEQVEESDDEQVSAIPDSSFRVMGAEVIPKKSIFSDVLPSLDLDVSRIPERVDRAGFVEPKGMPLAERLAVCEAEMDQTEASGSVTHATVCFEAGRLASLLGAREVACAHYDSATHSEGFQSLVRRENSRAALSRKQWSRVSEEVGEMVRYAGEGEQSGMAAYHIGILMAAGEEVEAQSVLEAQFGRSPGDVTVLLLRLQLAFAAGGHSAEIGAALEKLSEYMEDEGLRLAFNELQARSVEVHDELAADAMYEGILSEQASSFASLLGRLRIALRRDQLDKACLRIRELVQVPAVQQHQSYMSALLWRSTMLVKHEDVAADVRNALIQATTGMPDEGLLWRELGFAYLRFGEGEHAAKAFLRLADVGSTCAEQGEAFRLAASLQVDAGARADALLHVLELDPTDVLAQEELRRCSVHARNAAGLVDVGERLPAVKNGFSAVMELERIRALWRLDATEEAISAMEHVCQERLGERVSSSSQMVWGVDAVAFPLCCEYAEMLIGAGRLQECARWYEKLAGMVGDDSDRRIWRLRAALLAFRLVYRDNEGENRGVWIESAQKHWRSLLQGESRMGATEALVQLAVASGEKTVGDVLAEQQSTCEEGALAVEYATRRVHADSSAETMKDIFSGLPWEDPRVLLRHVIAGAHRGRMEEIADALVARADALGDGLEVDCLRFRAAAMYREHADNAVISVQQASKVVERRPMFAAAIELVEAVQKSLDDPNSITADEEWSEAVSRSIVSSQSQEQFASLIREAELSEYGSNDLRSALALYRKALRLRAGHPIARMGLTRTAAALGEASVAGEFALEALRDAENRQDAGAKERAYEQLAWIDGTVRGDRSAAIVAWEACLRIAPKNYTVLRNLQRAHAQQQSWGGLLAMYGTMLEHKDKLDAQQVVPVALEVARLAEKLKRPQEVILHSYEIVYEADPMSRPALFWVEYFARQQGMSRLLATFENAIADYYVRDPRARAAFLTRSGETYAGIGAIETAIDHFRAANDLLPGYLPALLAWREIALSVRSWLDVSEAAQRAAEASPGSTDRAQLNYEAAVALMDGAGNRERAVWALQKVLVAEPAHSDAFARLCALLEEQRRFKELAEILGRRLEIEKKPRERMNLRFSLARLQHEYINEPIQAMRGLRAVLEMDSDYLPAIEMLCDIAWEQQEWNDAAEMLTSMTRLERDLDKLTAIYSKLGAIYMDQIPNYQWAVRSFQRALSYSPNHEEALIRLSELGEKVQDWKTAINACERLIKTARNSVAKIRHLHRAGRIYHEGFQDRVRAERCYRIALELDPGHPEVLSQFVSYFRKIGDLDGMRVQLGRMCLMMRKQLATHPLHGPSYAVLAKALQFVSDSGRLEAAAGAWNAAQMADRLGVEWGSDRTWIKQPDLIRSFVVGNDDVDDVLFSSEVPYALRQILSRLGSRLNKEIGVDLRPYEVKRSQRLRDAKNSIVKVMGRVAKVMKQPQPEVYISTQYPTVLACEATEPVSIIIGSDIAELCDSSALRFIAGRYLFLAASNLIGVAKISSEDLGVLLTVVLRHFRKGFSPQNVDLESVREQKQRMRRLVSRGLSDELRLFAAAIAVPSFDPNLIWRGIQETADRAGLVACGSIGTALDVLAIAHEYVDLPHAASDPMVTSLLRFSIGDDYIRLRALCS